jgi:hypothetical protein
MTDAFVLKYPKTNPVSAVKGITYFDDIDFTVPVEMIAGQYKWKSIEKRLLEMVKSPHKIFSANP